MTLRNFSLCADELWRLLKELGVDRKRRDHPTLGAPETLVEEFVKRRWAEMENRHHSTVRRSVPLISCMNC